MEPLRKKLRNKNCTNCVLHKTTENVCLIGDGPYPTDIMFVGESPSNRSTETMNLPFAGRAGKILDVILEEVELSREDVFITNVVHCNPPGNRKPTMDELRTCREYLLQEIKEVKPKIIVTLGDSALKGLLDSNTFSIGRERGKVIMWEGIKVIPTYHPAAALRNPYFGEIILSDLKQGLGLGSTVKQTPKGKYILANPDNKEVLSRLMEAPVIALDIETTGLDWMDLDLRLVSFNMTIKPGESFVFKSTPSCISAVKKILDNKELIVNHNIKFDLQWLWRYDIKPTARIFDTMVAKHLLDENYPEKDLKHLSRVDLNMLELSELAKVIQKHWKDGTHPSWDEWVQYGGADSDAAFRLYELYSKQLEKEGLSELMKSEMKVLKTLTRMEIFGMQIDTKVHSKLTSEYKVKIEASQSKIKKLVGDINLNSPKQLAQLLYKDLRLPILAETDNGAPSCNEATLLALGELRNLKPRQSEILKCLLEYRTVAKLYTVYLEGLTKNGHLKHDGKVHCDFKICGTKTGRLSCSDPNLQNIPRNGDIKKMFISSFRGGSLIQLDYSQMELRILAHYSNDKNLIRAFKEGRDIHTETTSKCLHKPYSEVTEEERKIIGKRVNFGIVYLIGPAGLASKINCTVDEAKEYIKNWYAEFSGCREWMNNRREMIIETGKSPAFNGRTRRLYGASTETGDGREAIRQGTNSPIQGGAGDITKWSMYRLDRRLNKEGLKSRVICNVHDAIMVDCPKEEVDQVVELMKEVCKEPQYPLRIPLGFDIKVGPNWADLKLIK